MKAQGKASNNAERQRWSPGLTPVESTLIMSILAMATILIGTVLEVTPSDVLDGLAAML